ncbi:MULTISPECIES: YafY family protein [unclassified Adlercreutzia]|uniref:helix-turn-helix transcriptional regulator n=1 Tax=unclassified Adlercreutzia TaxID=2636013 RepID=UPI0013EDBE66|nr:MULTISPECIES: WYL domain-containing protein [unclassified Adlercreutzia]
MTANNKSKLKLLYIMQMLQNETDEQHGISMAHIIENLNELGIYAERKSVYRDINVLREFGMDIKIYKRKPVEYAIAQRSFELPELMLLVDAVESSKFLTVRQSRALTTNIKLLASNSQRKQLDRQIHVAGRIKNKSDGVFEYIDTIHKALRDRKKISFVYCKYGVDGKKHPTHDGKPHIVTPVKVVYADGFYYLTTWNDKHENFTEFRIDRMERLKVSDEHAASNNAISNHMFDETAHEYFGRFDGEGVIATLHVQGDKVEILMDRFGEHARISPIGENEAQALVRIRKSEQFFGWIASMGGAVTIDKPKSLLQEYKDYLRRLLEN